MRHRGEKSRDGRTAWYKYIVAFGGAQPRRIPNPSRGGRKGHDRVGHVGDAIRCFLARAIVRRLSQSCRPLRGAALGWCCDDAPRQADWARVWEVGGWVWKGVREGMRLAWV